MAVWVLHHSIQSSRPAPGLLFDLRTGVFVQLKVHYTASSSGDAGRRCYAAARRGLDELRLHRVGALLLRGPSEEARQTGKLTDDDVGAWRALQRLVKEGRADLKGVCTFPPSLLEELLRLDGPR